MNKKKRNDAPPEKMRLAVVGHPIEHSASPAIYRAAFRALGLDAEFSAVDPPDFRDAIRSLCAHGYRGAAVTIPFKEEAFELADQADETASAAGAANTLVFEHGVHASNTDIIGILKAFEEHGVSLKGEVVTILGAGGAARAAAVAAHHGGAKHVILLARTLAKGDRIAEELGAALRMSIEARPFVEEEIIRAVARSTVLINTTPVGMSGQEGIPLPSRVLHKRLTVLDTIYRPAATKLIQEARVRCAAAIPGTSMFLAQAAAQFRIFTGREAPVSVMAQALKEVPGCDWP